MLLFSLAKLWRAQFAIYCCIVIASLPGEFLTLFSAGQNSQSVRNRWALWVCREVPYRIRPKIQRHLRKVTCKCFMLFYTSQSMSNNGRKAGATILFLSVIMHRKVEQISHAIFLLFSSTAVCLVSLAAVFLRHHATLLLTIATNEWSHHRISSMSK